MEVTGPSGTFYLLINYNGYYVGAVGQQVGVDGSPVVIRFDTPIIPIGNPPTIDLGAAYQMIRQYLPDTSQES
jgi:hypothetical protein